MLQFHHAFATHFSLHQFGVTTKCDCEITIHDIICILDLHLDLVIFRLDITNNFNLLSRGVIFQKLHAIGGNIIQFIPFIMHSMHLSFFCFIVIIIMKAMSYSSHLPCDPSRWSHGRRTICFSLFGALHSTTGHFPFYLFPSIANYIHIISPFSIISYAYEHL